MLVLDRETATIVAGQTDQIHQQNHLAHQALRFQKNEPITSNVKLTVTPQVTAEGSILVKVVLQNQAPKAATGTAVFSQYNRSHDHVVTEER